MRRILLAVYHLYFMVTQVSDERRERDFRGIGAMREHRFAEKHAPERHAIKTAYALALEPRFNAVRPSFAMQRGIRFHDIRRDPGAALAFARRLGARTHHAGEIIVHANFPRRL